MTRALLSQHRWHKMMENYVPTLDFTYHIYQMGSSACWINTGGLQLLQVTSVKTFTSHLLPHPAKSLSVNFLPTKVLWQLRELLSQSEVPLHSAGEERTNHYQKKNLNQHPPPKKKQPCYLSFEIKQTMLLLQEGQQNALPEVDELFIPNTYIF